MVNRLWYETVMPILWRNPIRKIENQIYHKLGILNIKYNRLNVISSIVEEVLRKFCSILMILIMLIMKVITLMKVLSILFV